MLGSQRQIRQGLKHNSGRCRFERMIVGDRRGICYMLLVLMCVVDRLLPGTTAGPADKPPFVATPRGPGLTEQIS